jgi:acyl-CoA thioesterase FadM
VGLSEHRGADALRSEGYRFVIDVVPGPTDFDAQGHLNNASTVRLFNDLRMAYVRAEVGEVWMEILRNDQLVVAAREVHVLYESEGLPGESFVGAMRYLRREGKAAVRRAQLSDRYGRPSRCAGAVTVRDGGRRRPGASSRGSRRSGVEIDLPGGGAEWGPPD